MIIDSHCHLSSEDYEDVLVPIKNMGDNIMIVSGCDHLSNVQVVDLCSKFPNIFGVIGIHPSEIGSDIDFHLKYIEEHINDKHIVGIGEIGLDYHYGDDKDVQKKYFIKQIELALKYNTPIVIHTRDAIQDTYDILKEYNAYKVPVYIHCFSESVEMAREFIKLGARIGIGGVVTFKNSRKLVDVVSEVDLSHILLETDSPYLTPEPYRGRRNEPCNVFLVAEKVASIKGVDVEKVIEMTTRNSIDQFDLKV